MESNKHHGIDLLEGEIFAPCPVEGYEVSNFGRIVSLKCRNPKFLKYDRYKDRGLRVYLSGKESPKNRYRVHKLVAEAFVPNPNGFRFVRHKDGDKTNNHFSNLEWFDYEDPSVVDKFKRIDGIEVFEDEVFHKSIGFDGYYVSNYGKVISVKREVPHLMKMFFSRGQPLVSAIRDGSSRNLLIHRQVASIFVPNPKRYRYVRHIDGDISNNHFTNLEWYKRIPSICYTGKWSDSGKSVDECIELIDGEIFYTFDVEGLEQYNISNMGRVASLDIDGRWHLRKLSKLNSGYLSVNLYNSVEKKYKNILIATYLLKRFVGPRKNNQVCGYKDGDSYNCRLDNLYWRDKSRTRKEKDVHIIAFDGGTVLDFYSYSKAGGFIGMSPTHLKRLLESDNETLVDGYVMKEVSDGR